MLDRQNLHYAQYSNTAGDHSLLEVAIFFDQDTRQSFIEKRSMQDPACKAIDFDTVVMLLHLLGDDGGCIGNSDGTINSELDIIDSRGCKGFIQLI